MRAQTQTGSAGGPRPFVWDGTDVYAMSIVDLIKATLVCGAIAFVIYSFPVVGQVVVIGFLSLLWLLYAHNTIAHLRRR